MDAETKVELTPRAGEKRIQIPWRSSYWAVLLLAISFGVLAIVTSLGVDWMMHGFLRPVYASDVLEAIALATFSGVAFFRMQARKRELLQRMQVVEDVNHHVRNALTSIVLSASLRSDPELNAQIEDACDRIDWVLSDVLPQSVETNGNSMTDARWKPGRQFSHANMGPHRSMQPK